MKIIFNLLKGAFIGLFLVFGFTGCDSDSDPAPQWQLPDNLHGIFILNQGGDKQNNASLSLYNTETGIVYNDILSGNGGKLGDLGQDMLVYGSKLYIVVSNSSRVTVLDLAKRNVKSIELFEGGEPRNPRYLAASMGKIFATCSTDGTVARIDTVSLAVDGNVKVGANPEGIAVARNLKLYVANSGYGAGNTVSVVNIATFNEERKIEVGLNPNFVRTSGDDYVYLSHQGNFNGIPGGFQRIRITDNFVETLSDAPKTDFALANGFVYFYDVTYDPTDWSSVNLFGKFNAGKNDFQNVLPIIDDDAAIVSPYGIELNSAGNIYIADAGDYVNPGKVFIFNSEGKKTKELTVGVNPCKLAFY